MTSAVFMGSYYGETHMGAPIGFNYWRATFDCMSNPGQRIRQLRRAQGLNQKDLAPMIGIDQSTLSDIENGAGFMADKLMHLAAALGTTAEQIMRGHDPRSWPFESIDISRFFALDIRQRTLVEGKLDAAIQAFETAHTETKTAKSLGQNVTYDSDKATRPSHHTGAVSAPGGRPVLVPTVKTTRKDDELDRLVARQNEAAHGERSANRKFPQKGNARRR